mgnify:CR=1 FL=1
MNKKSKRIIFYIHAGFHKTGTTAIQNFFDLNYERLLKQGVLYPKDIRYNDSFNRGQFAHHYLAWNLGFGNDPQRSEEARNESKGFDFELALREEIKASKPRAVILSSEVFGEKFIDVNLTRLKDFFQGFDLNFIFYIRRHDNVVISDYKNRVVQGSFTGSIFDYLKLGAFDFNVFFKQYLKYFDPGNIKIRVYEKGQMKGNLFEDILNEIGVKYQNDFNLPNLTKSNVSLNDAYTEIMRKCNSSFDSKRKNKLKRVMLKIQEKPARAENSNLLSYDQRLEIINRFMPSYENIARTFLHRANGQLFYEMPEKSKVIADNQSDEELVRLIDELLGLC